MCWDHISKLVALDCLGVRLTSWCSWGFYCDFGVLSEACRSFGKTTVNWSLPNALRRRIAHNGLFLWLQRAVKVQWLKDSHTNQGKARSWNLAPIPLILLLHSPLQTLNFTLWYFTVSAADTNTQALLLYSVEILLQYGRYLALVFSQLEILVFMKRIFQKGEQQWPAGSRARLGRQRRPSSTWNYSVSFGRLRIATMFCLLLMKCKINTF